MHRVTGLLFVFGADTTADSRSRASASSDSIQDRLEELFEEHTRGDFMEADDSPIAKHAAEIANAHITGGTRKAQRR